MDALSPSGDDGRSSSKGEALSTAVIVWDGNRVEGDAGAPYVALERLTRAEPVGLPWRKNLIGHS